MLGGLDLATLDASRFVNAIAELFIRDGMIEHAKERDQARAKLLLELGYNGAVPYGRSNDDPTDRAPLPYIPETEQTEDGFLGLDPPMG